MFGVSKSRVIEAPPEHVFAYLVDVGISLPYLLRSGTCWFGNSAHAQQRACQPVVGVACMPGVATGPTNQGNGPVSGFEND